MFSQMDTSFSVPGDGNRSPSKDHTESEWKRKLERVVIMSDTNQRFQFSLRSILLFAFAFALGFACKNLASGLQPFAMSLVLPSSNSPVQPGDVLLVESNVDPGGINRRVTVLADGIVTLPQVGDVSVAGTSLAAVEQSLTKEYQKFYANPGIQVYRADASVPHK